MGFFNRIKDNLKTYPIIWLLVSNTLICIFNAFFDISQKTNLIVGIEESPFSIRLIIVFLLVEAFAICLFIFQRKAFTKKLNETKKAAITNAQPDEETQIMQKHRAFYNKLIDLFRKKAILLSAQIYESSELVDPNLISNLDVIYFDFKRIGGYSRDEFITNCVLFERFECSMDFYRKLYPLLIDIRNICLRKDSRNTHVSQSEIADLAERITAFIKFIKPRYFDIKTIDDISEKHFFYYSVLQLLTRFGFTLADWGLNDSYKTSFITNTGYLLTDVNVPTLVEDYLKRSKRTGLLGAFFTNRLHLFGNENSDIRIKQSRNYFAAPLDNNTNKYFVFTYDHSLLGSSREMPDYACCKELFREIKTELGGATSKV